MIREDCVSRGRGIIHAGNTQRCGVHRGVRAQIAAPHTATDTVYACMVNRTGNRRLLDEVRRIPVPPTIANRTRLQSRLVSFQVCPALENFVRILNHTFTKLQLSALRSPPPLRSLQLEAYIQTQSASSSSL
jgi:hypothetical protein